MEPSTTRVLSGDQEVVVPDGRGGGGPSRVAVAPIAVINTKLLRLWGYDIDDELDSLIASGIDESDRRILV